MKKQKKRLFRVDVEVSYLVITNGEDYEFGDVEDWIKEEFHSGELEEKTQVKEVKNIEEVSDFGDGYSCYGEEGPGGDYYSLEEISDELGLDAQKLIDRLNVLGYTVIKETGYPAKGYPATKKAVKKIPKKTK